jgi:hypothetical protein
MSKIAMIFPRVAVAPTGPARGGRGFFNWLKVAQPRIWKATMLRVGDAEGLAGLGLTDPNAATTAVSDAPVSNSLADKIKDIVFGVSQAYLTAQQLSAQKKVLDMQLSRAKAGLPPLDLDLQQYGLTGPQVSVGLSSQTQTLLIIGVVGIAAVYLLPKLLKR